MKITLYSALFLLFVSQNIFAQHVLKTQAAPQAADVVVKNQFIEAIVGANDGLITVLPIGADPGPSGPCTNGGRLGLDAQLSFYKHSYFTCKIGTLYYTNNDLITNVAPNAHSNLNSYGVTSYISDVTGNKIDTIRTIWAANKQSGVQITQDIFCIPFTKSGQVVFSWKFTNTTVVSVPVACQYLNDIDIGDPCDKRNANAPDGPKILTQYQYDSNWTQFPNTTVNAIPPFYIGFNIALPGGPAFNPGLNAMGYLTSGPPLNVITPVQYTNGDWGIMATSHTAAIFGPSPSAQPYNSGFGIGSDNAILLVFPTVSIAPGETVEVGRTSYGTGEYERCIGNLFSIVFYPHHLVWTKDPHTPPGSYSPNPIHVEKFVVDPGPPQNENPAANTKVTLNVSKGLTISDNTGKTFFGSSQTYPVTKSINPGGVGYFDWWVFANPLEFCIGPSMDTLTFTATCSFCPPAFNDQIGSLGSDECQLLIEQDCAEADVDAPLFSDTDFNCHSVRITVGDIRATDRGLASITWAPTPSSRANFVTDSSKFSITVTPAVTPCNTDIINHIVTISKINAADSLLAGSFDFTFVDCIGNTSTHTVSLGSCTVNAQDVLAPQFENIAGTTPFQKLVTVHDNRSGDWGLKNISWTPLSGTDSTKFTVSYTPALGACDTDKTVHTVTINQADSTIGGCYRFAFQDCAGNNSFDTVCLAAHKAASGVRSCSYEFSFAANHPNPFSTVTTFDYTIADHSAVKLSLFDELGREVAIVLDEFEASGSYRINFDGTRLPEGNYIARLVSGGSVLSQKIVIER
jgi:hypothetical protein